MVSFEQQRPSAPKASYYPVVHGTPAVAEDTFDDPPLVYPDESFLDHDETTTYGPPPGYLDMLLRRDEPVAHPADGVRPAFSAGPVTDDRPEESEEGASEDTLRAVVGGLRDSLGEDPALRRARRAADRLDMWTRPDRAASPDAVVAAALAAREVCREIAVAAGAGRLRGDLLDRIEPWLGALGDALDEDLDVPRRRTPMWLDVASPPHGRVNVRGLRTHFEAGHVTAGDSDVVVQADDCRLDAIDHYHVRRVSLDCTSLYRDPAVIEAFVAVMLDPSDRNVGAFAALLRGLVGPPVETGEALHREAIAPHATSLAEHSGLVVQGDGTTLSSTTHYHVRETVIPLAELLNARPELIRSLAAALRPETGAADPLAEILSAVGALEIHDLLRRATGLDDGVTEVSRSFGGTRVDLAAAVLVGCGNELRRRSEIDVAPRLGGHLAKFDRAVARRYATVAAAEPKPAEQDRPGESPIQRPPERRPAAPDRPTASLIHRSRPPERQRAEPERARESLIHRSRPQGEGLADQLQPRARRSSRPVAPDEWAEPRLPTPSVSRPDAPPPSVWPTWGNATELPDEEEPPTPGFGIF